MRWIENIQRFTRHAKYSAERPAYQGNTNERQMELLCIAEGPGENQRGVTLTAEEST